MEKLGLHPGLESRLDLLAERILEARRKAGPANELELIEMRGRVSEMQERYDAWEKRLLELNAEGSGLFARLKAGMAQVAFDVDASFQSFGNRLDATFRTGNARDRNRSGK
ncbi:MAG: hypothetical protein EKK29_07795 [Hyphomicrobiales bacterium]|nr:MAG: hypothetical protein EKK29_07795 [Hyphomicrobiales bacterium]